MVTEHKQTKFLKRKMLQIWNEKNIKKFLELYYLKKQRL